MQTADWWREFEQERERAAREPPLPLVTLPDAALVARFQVQAAALVRVLRDGKPACASDLAFLRRFAGELDAAARLWQGDRR